METVEKLVASNRIGRIIALLSSDRDGEVLSAVAALRRTLAANGSDLYDLISLLEGKVRVVQADGPPMTWREKLAMCRRDPNFLNEWEKAFVENLAQWDKPTERQRAVLDKLYKSLYT